MDVLARVHARRYLDFLATAWDEWIALDPANRPVVIWRLFSHA